MIICSGEHELRSIMTRISLGSRVCGYSFLSFLVQSTQLNSTLVCSATRLASRIAFLPFYAVVCLDKASALISFLNEIPPNSLCLIFFNCLYHASISCRRKVCREDLRSLLCLESDSFLPENPGRWNVRFSLTGTSVVLTTFNSL